MKKVLLSILFLCLTASGALCEEQDAIDLERIVVTPARGRSKMSDTAGNVSVITKKEIESSNAKSIPELLTMEGSVIMRDYIGNGKTVNADMRGFGETGLSNILVLIDGRRVNNIDLSGTDWTQIPVSMIEKIEILRGASSVLYGDNASGGVVNIATKEPSKKHEIKSGVVIGSFGTYGERAEFSVTKNNFSALGLFDQYRTDGYRINSDLIRNDINGKLTYSFNDNAKAKISFGNHEDKYGLPGALLDSQLNTRDRKSSVTPDDYASSRDYFIDLGIEGELGELGNLELDLSRRKRDTISFFIGGFPWISERDTITYAANPKYSLEKNILGHKNKLLFGLDYFEAEQDINDGAFSGNPDKATISKKSYGLYLNDQIYITDSFSFNAGYRRENARYNFEQEQTVKRSEAKDFTEDVFSTALNYKYMPDSNIYVSFEDSFRHPLVDEYFNTSAFSPSGINISLTPQTAKNYETGLRHRFNKHLGFGVTGYIIKLHNEIYYEPTTFTNTTYDNTVHQGAEFNAEINPNETVTFFSNYTFTDAHFEGGIYNKNRIPSVPSHKWGLGSKIKLNRNFSLSLLGNYTGERYFISDQTNSLPRMASYFVVDSKLNFKKDNLSVFAGINNLFNEDYYEYGAANSTRTAKNYYPAAKRNFTLGASFNF